MNSTAKSGRIEPTVARILAEHGVGEGDRLLIACSGGNDSVALLVAACRAAGPNVLLNVAYLDHGLRPLAEISAERKLLEHICESLGVQISFLEAGKGSLAQGAAKTGRSVEEFARTWRYTELEAERIRTGARYILVGHHLDDQLETLIMRIFQGSHASGLRGMGVRNGRILRPLLGFHKRDLVAYLEARSIQPSEDSTNSSTEILRNAVRAHLTPAVTRVFPGYRTALAALQRKSRWMNQFLKSETTRRISWSFEVVESVAILHTNYEAFFREPEIVRLYSLYEAANRIDSRERTTPGARHGAFRRRIPFRFFRAVVDGKDAQAGNRTIARGHGIRIERTGDSLCLKEDIVQGGKRGYLLSVIGTGVDVPVTPGIRVVVHPDQTGGFGGPGGIFLEYEIIAPPLLIRSRRSGDRILTAAGTKSLKKLLVDFAIPEQDRDDVPVLEDRNGILGVLLEPFGGKDVVSVRAACEAIGVGGHGSPRRGLRVTAVRRSSRDNYGG